MIVATDAQKPIPLGGITGDNVHIWNADLEGIDDILNDQRLIDIIWRAFHRGKAPQKPTRGRRAMALNRTLRCGVLKHIKRWSWRDLGKETQRNLDYRAFTQFFDTKLPDVSTFNRRINKIDAQALREINEWLCQQARDQGVIQGRRYRQDTTVCETNIHYPTDSSLLQDGARVLRRAICRAEQIAPSLGQTRDRAKSIQRRIFEIAQAARWRGEPARRRREKKYRSLLRIVRPVVTEATRAARKLGDRRVTRHLDRENEILAQNIKEELDTVIPKVEQVIAQTRARICRGINNYPNKLLSIFEPKTCVIRKGKAHKPTEFGRLVDIIEVENGFVSDYQVLDGNPFDGTLLIPALVRHKARFGRAPHLAATDRGYWSAKNEKEAYALGVKRVSIPIRGKL
jgi:IS5 family transposase